MSYSTILHRDINLDSLKRSDVLLFNDMERFFREFCALDSSNHNNEGLNFVNKLCFICRFYRVSTIVVFYAMYDFCGWEPSVPATMSEFFYNRILGNRDAIITRALEICGIFRTHSCQSSLPDLICLEHIYAITTTNRYIYGASYEDILTKLQSDLFDNHDLLINWGTLTLDDIFSEVADSHVVFGIIWVVIANLGQGIPDSTMKAMLVHGAILSRYIDMYGLDNCTAIDFASRAYDIYVHLYG